MMILQTLSTVLMVAAAQTGGTTQTSGLTDAEVMRRLHALHTRMAQLADAVRVKSSNASVKTYATTVANDHRRMDRVLMSIADGAKITLGTPSWTQAEGIDNRGFADAMNKMKTMPADRSYDRAFLELLLEDHNAELNMLQTEKNRTDNGRLRDHMQELITVELKHRNRALELDGRRPPAAS